MGTVHPIKDDPKIERILSEKELYALIVVEQKAIEFSETRLKNAHGFLQQVEQNLAHWNQQKQLAITSITEVNGAIAGCNSLIHDELAKLGVSRETFDRQKEEYYAEIEAFNESKREKDTETKE